MAIRTLIVDDEALARERIATLLAREEDFTVVGECSDGRQALAAIPELRPDLVFLDIQMPELDGLSLLAELGEENLPAIIFVTAFDAYALKAFEVHALDYLLKPFDRQRFVKALERARALVAHQASGGVSEQLKALLADLQGQRKAPGRFVVRIDGRLLFLKPEEIDWIEAAGNYVKIHCGKDEHLLRETLASVEARLREDQFLRIHRSTLVNIDRIRELQPWFQGDYLVILRDGTKLNMSRGFKEKASRILGV